VHVDELVADRRTSTWISVDFEDQAYRGYTVADFDTLVRDCRFLRLVERPSTRSSQDKRLVSKKLRKVLVLSLLWIMILATSILRRKLCNL
jgi:hypothetical protein